MSGSGISACLIVKNEEHNLRACLESIRPWVDEICIADTGSSDGTLAIAREFSAKIILFPWTESFAEARNASLSMAGEAWILVIDADERLRPECGPRLRSLVEGAVEQAFLVYQDNPSVEGGCQSIALPRLFRNRPEIRFSRRIHESVMTSLIALGAGNPNVVDVHLEHVGYSREQIARAGKNERNKELLRLEVQDDPADLFALYKLGQTLDPDTEAGEKLQTYAAAFRFVELMPSGQYREYPFIPLIYSGYAEILVFAGVLAAAGAVIAAVSEEMRIPEIVWREADLAWRRGDLETAMNGFQSCLGLPIPDPRVPSDARFRGLAARVRLGDIALELGDPQAFLQLVGEVNGADDLSLHCRAQQVRALLACGSEQKALAQLERLVGGAGFHPEVRLLLGEISLQQNDDSTALDLFTKASGTSDAGQQAKLQRMLMALRNNDLSTAERLRKELVLRDVKAAAMALFVAVLEEAEFVCDEVFTPAALIQQLTHWLSQLVEKGDEEVLRRFVNCSVAYSGQFPGIDRLLVDDDR